VAYKKSENLPALFVTPNGKRRGGVTRNAGGKSLSVFVKKITVMC